MKTIEERIENLSDEDLDRLACAVSQINCGSVDCRECPMQTESGCMFTKFYDEQGKRRARVKKIAAELSTTELESKAQELVKQLDLLVELLRKF